MSSDYWQSVVMQVSSTLFLVPVLILVQGSLQEGLMRRVTDKVQDVAAEVAASAEEAGDGRSAAPKEMASRIESSLIRNGSGRVKVLRESNHGFDVVIRGRGDQRIAVKAYDSAAVPSEVLRRLANDAYLEGHRPSLPLLVTATPLTKEARRVAEQLRIPVYEWDLEQEDDVNAKRVLEAVDRVAAHSSRPR